MTVQINDILECMARCEFQGVEDVVNVYQYQYVGPSPATDASCIAALSDAMDDLYIPLAAVQPYDYIYRDITIRNLTQDTVLGTTAWPTLTAGLHGGDNNAPGIAGLVNMATGIARVVLRKYIGGFVTAAIESNGTFTSAVTTVLSTFGVNLMSGYPIVSPIWKYGHFSPKTLNFEEPSTITVSDIPAYQRRRKQGRGV